ncbi:hypothetical protein IFM89_024258 [Coptis chinensis]|uniref:DNA topoisomerase (ATP-hydrolyzing) n=1 Tax=Coptis chinensis TaxID=261450 RepID=A0A835H8D5_9MAGN|nr:hypothetical protein IFM89_024258 [Coptis chinensis]
MKETQKVWRFSVKAGCLKKGVRIKGVVCFYHGASGIAKIIAVSGYAIFAIDHPSFGLSEGLHGYIPSFDELVDNVIERYRNIKVFAGKSEASKLPRFLLGQSMGGAVALKAHLKCPSEWDGVVLVAPMCKISEDVKPAPAILQVLSIMSSFLPEAKLVPDTDLGELAFRETKTRKKKMTAMELLKATKEIESQVSSPLLVLHGAADKVTDPLAILPLRGKILNIERKDEAAMYKNQEIQNLILALELGVKGEDFKKEALGYHKIIIMTDADVDGAYIRTLLLTFFYRYQKALFDEGCIYVGVPPLYKVERGKQAHYCYDEGQLKTLRSTFPSNASYNIQRFKGLGEMMPLQLWETTMDPKNRMLKQLVVEDAAEANMVFLSLMGDRVDVRKELITKAASTFSLEQLDI